MSKLNDVEDNEVCKKPYALQQKFDNEPVFYFRSKIIFNNLNFFWLPCVMMQLFRFSAYFLFVVALCLPYQSSGQSIFLDETDTEWPSTSIVFSDPKGDGNAAGIDFTSCKITNDENYLFLSVDVGKEVNIQDGNYLALWIDVDDNPSTGLLKYGIGADFVYFPGERIGRHYSGGSSFNVYHDEAGWVTSPTVTSRTFEIALLKNIEYSGKTVRLGNQIKLVFSDESVAGDRIPDAGNALSYKFSSTVSFRPRPFYLQKVQPNWLRILSYNVLKDNLFQSYVQSSSQRVFQAIRPDIIGFCEIYNASSAQTAGLISNYLPPGPDEAWYHGGVSPDIRIVSKYPVINTYSLDGNGAFLLDVKKLKIVVIVMHLPCCDNNLQRQQEVDKIMSFVRAIRFGISPFQVPQNTPVILVGDTNLVGFKQQQQTLLTGNIAANGTFGVDFDPDWDETSLEDAMPVTTNSPFTFTWNNRQGSYSAGRLDYILYTGSVMSLKNSFALWSKNLTTEQLQFSGLQVGDVEKISDHLPIVADFEIPYLSTAIQENSIQENLVILDQLDEIGFQCKGPSKIIISDLAGRLLYTVESNLPVSVAKSTFNAEGHVVIASVINLSTGKRISKLIPVY